MYARSTTIKGDPANVDAVIAFVRDEVMPMITSMDGCLGLSLVVDRESGRGIATSSWDSKEALDESRDSLAPVRARGGEILGGTPEVDEWEVAMMHRDHHTGVGACCRVTWGRVPDVDRAVGFFRDEVLPKAEGMNGFCNASLFIDRSTNRFTTTVTFDSHEALAESRTKAAGIRSHAGDRIGAEFLDIAEFDLELAHLHLPELV
ncbi:antibiotic biosynthesis monooxygenase [Nocardioides sp. GCM10027113]|uniref:antibiotic biosynthesis monooxygenase n=1 Tax=unclassified Nocardioides TaxID=2615069 RepID=UPI00361E29B5